MLKNLIYWTIHQECLIIPLGPNISKIPLSSNLKNNKKFIFFRFKIIKLYTKSKYNFNLKK